MTRAAGPLLARLGEIESSIYQVKNRSSQDPLNYPIQLNNKIAALGPTVASTEAKPTAQSYEAFRLLSAQLDAELKRLAEVLERQLPPVNAELKKAGAEPLVQQSQAAALPRKNANHPKTIPRSIRVHPRPFRWLCSRLVRVHSRPHAFLTPGSAMPRLTAARSKYILAFMTDPRSGAPELGYPRPPH